eukprot:11587553-Alexandrium_andersonii.AAC.1
MALYPQTAGLRSSAVFSLTTKRFFVGKRLAKLVDWRPHSRARPHQTIGLPRGHHSRQPTELSVLRYCLCGLARRPRSRTRPASSPASDPAYPS